MQGLTPARGDRFPEAGDQCNVSTRDADLAILAVLAYGAKPSPHGETEGGWRMALVYKTKQSEALDRFYSESPTLGKHLRDGLDLMKANPNKLSDAARPPESAGDLEAGSANDLDTWVAAPNGKDVERVMRLGYEAAIDLASKSEPEAKPIETFFIVGASSNFDLQICEGERAITVFMLIPGERSYGSKRATSKSWVVRVAGLRERAKKEQLDAEDLPVVKTQVSGAKD